MTLATKVFGAIGPKVYTPQGPLGTSGNTPLGDFDFGEVVFGDKESQFVFLQFIVEASLTLNQGDWLVWDSSFSAIQSNAAAGFLAVGSGAGTFFLGGRFGDTAAAPNAGNVWSYTFTPGVYGVWAQRFGVSAGNWGTITAQGDAAFTTTVAGQLAALAAAGAHGATVANAYTMPTTILFTATTTAGSNILTAPASTVGNVLKGLRKGMAISATNLPAGCVIADISGPTITLSNRLNPAGPNATASGSAQSMTVEITSCWATFTAGQFSMNVDGTYGMIPNMTLSGTGVGTSAVLNSIVGNTGPMQANVSVANAATEATPVLITGTGYVETMLRLPLITAQS